MYKYIYVFVVVPGGVVVRTDPKHQQAFGGKSTIQGC